MSELLENSSNLSSDDRLNFRGPAICENFKSLMAIASKRNEIKGDHQQVKKQRRKLREMSAEDILAHKVKQRKEHAEKERIKRVTDPGRKLSQKKSTLKKSGYGIIGKNAVSSDLALEHRQELLQHLTHEQQEVILDTDQADRPLPRAMKKKEQFGTCSFCQDICNTKDGCNYNSCPCRREGLACNHTDGIKCCANPEAKVPKLMEAVLESFLQDQDQDQDQYGLVAKEDIKRFELIAEYTGRVVTGKAEKKKLSKDYKSEYLMSLTFRHPKYGNIDDKWVDGRFGNETRYINTACRTNARAVVWGYREKVDKKINDLLYLRHMMP
jgi:hypothetical protein